MKRILVAFILVPILFLFGCGGSSESDFGPYDTDITRLELEVGGAEVVVTRGEDLRVETDNPYIRAFLRHGTLKIQESGHIADLDSSTVTVYIPQTLVFEDAELSAGAGKLQIDGLSCRQLELELGAGLVEIFDLNALHSAEISGGAGKIILHNGSLNRLDLDLGVGEAEITTALSGECEISAGVGNLNLRILGNPQDFSIHAQPGLGSLEVDGIAVTGRDTIGTGPNRLEIEGGIGTVRVNFQ